VQVYTTPSMGAAPGSTAPMVPARKKSGCGCCGCLGGCLLLLLLSVGLLAASVFFLDTGKLVDRGLGFSYYQFARPWIIETISVKSSPEDRQQVIMIADTFVATYLNMSEEEKKPLRKELIQLLYYSSQGKPFGMEKFPHVESLRDQVMKKVLKENPQWGTLPGYNPRPVPPPGAPKTIRPPTPIAPPPQEKPMPRLKF